MESPPLLLKKPVKSLRHSRRGIGQRCRSAVARDARQVLPGWRSQRIGVLHGVSFSQLSLKREDEVVSCLGWGKNDRRGPDPKAAQNGKAAAAWNSGEGLGNGAPQLKAAAGAECCAAARDHAPGDGEAAAALGDRRGGNGNE